MIIREYLTDVKFKSSCKFVDEHQVVRVTYWLHPQGRRQYYEFGGYIYVIGATICTAVVAPQGRDRWQY
jgi:hypothetical protein